MQKLETTLQDCDALSTGLHVEVQAPGHRCTCLGCSSWLASGSIVLSQPEARKNSQNDQSIRWPLLRSGRRRSRRRLRLRLSATSGQTNEMCSAVFCATGENDACKRFLSADYLLAHDSRGSLAMQCCLLSLRKKAGVVINTQYLHYADRHWFIQSLRHTACTEC